MLATIAITSIIICYFMTADSMKIKKQLDLGNKYLTELNYDLAIATFDAVIKLDPNNKDGYEGKAGAYVGKSESQKDYDTKLENLLNAYLTYEDAIKVFEGNENIDNSNEIVGIFRSNQTEIIKQMESIISEYVDYLITQRDISKIIELRDKYGEYVSYDFDSAIADIEEVIAKEEQERIEKENRDNVLAQIYNVLSNENWEAADVVYNSSEYKAVEESYCYKVFEGSEDTGKGAAIYNNHLYYGDIVDGICEGEGTWFSGTSVVKLYYYYQGEFKNNVPNGKIVGTMVDLGENYKNGGTCIVEGYMVDGLWDGDAVEHESYSGYYHYFDHMTFKNGIGMDQRDISYPYQEEFAILRWGRDDTGIIGSSFPDYDTTCVFGAFGFFP